MEFEIKLVNVKEQPVAYVRTRCLQADLPKVIGGSYGKIMHHLGTMRVQPTCAPYAAYYNLDMNDLDVEMGFPIPGRIAPGGDVLFRVLPEGYQIETLYKGPYSGMIEAYTKMQEWMEKNAYEVVGPVFEYYLTPPEVPESEHLTKIVFPVSKK
jgi:effector-binding domain-containing protein